MPDLHDIGYADGAAAYYTRGGTKGADWHADQKGLAGEDRKDYIDGFNLGLDSMQEETSVEDEE